ncbi:MAG TPA: polysaccharide biosynthesis tyrosine autokinase [Anaerolineae bacterium]|nr:polysaccharide biosynthesis tyrosine autokinase [Anaerolineae bacterium]HQK13150.1 polysaccharide biosynthesis tyrosine autokinase [Anaerolineae bacterium]
MELKQYFGVIKKWWWLAVTCVLIASVSSYMGTQQMPRIYSATTTLMVGQALQQANPSSQEIYLSQQLAQTYATMVKRKPILEGAARALGLQYIPAAGNVSARVVPGSQLLEITVLDTDPERARILADEIAQQLIKQTPTDSPEVQERRAFVQQQLKDLEDKIKTTKAEIEEEQKKLDAANSARAIQQYQSNISALQQKLSSYQSTYASLLTTVQGGINYVTVVEPASKPTSPISPNVSQTVMLAAGIGLALALGGAFLIEYLDDTVKTPEEAAQLTGLPALGAIARIEGKTLEDRLITAHHPLSPIAEAYRVLRTNIQFSTVDKPLKTLMVTSPAPSEGKSVTLANLAVVMAQSGLKVIAVDTDLRRPIQHKIFDIANESGLCDGILHANPSIMEYVQPTQVENLWLLPSGTIPPNPAELLGSKRMGEIIEELKANADLLIFDTPPALLVTDAAVLANRVDGVLLVNDAGSTRRGMTQRAAEELRRVHAPLLGLVMNRLSTRRGSYYYYQYYHYKYYRHEDGTVEKRRSKSERKRRRK